MTDHDRFRLSPLELAMGDAVGLDPNVPPLEPVPPGTEPLSMLEAAVVPALARPPCVVAFSGGRDSSAVLAVATGVARKEGLPVPVPVTQVYPNNPETDETRWQELVIRHLGLTEWERVEVTGELDLLGPVARRLLTRHGMLWPPNFYSFEPLIERARHGSFMSGSEGDELFGGWRWRPAADVMARRRALSFRGTLRVGLAASPQFVKRAVVRRRWDIPPMIWLRPDAEERARESVVRHQASEPSAWDKRVDWYARQRWLSVDQHSTKVMADDHDVLAIDPLLDRRFLAALGAAGGRVGFGDRTRIMSMLFGELLPRAVVERRDKVLFTLAFWGRESRAFSERWNGEGVDRSLVDVDGLRRAWEAEVPDARSAPLLQAAWLNGAAHGTEESLDDVVDGVPPPGA